MKRHAALLSTLLLVLAAACLSCGSGGSDEHAGHDHDEHADHDEGPDDDAGHDDHEGHDDEGHEEGVVELGSEAAAAARIRTTSVLAGNWADRIQTTGEVHFDGTRLAHVSPRLEGRIHQVSVELGQHVAAGDALAIIDSVELGTSKAEYLSAKARLGLAQSTLDREEGLLERHITSEQQVIEARAARQEAAAMEQAASDKLRVLGVSKTDIQGIRHSDPKAPLFTVRAPISGKVVELHATLGELVGPATEFATVADLSRLWIWVDVYERDLRRVSVGDGAEVRLDAFPEEVIAGRVAYLKDEVDRDTRTVRARLDVDNAEEKMKPGMFARVLLEHGGSDAPTAGAVSVPPTAILRQGGEFLAFVKAGTHRYEVRNLRVGRRSKDQVEVLSGLAPGDEVVVEGGFILKSELGKGEMGHGHSH
jgi:cobalt-zinc-cadmium efflux system membrane fusion protein